MKLSFFSSARFRMGILFLFALGLILSLLFSGCSQAKENGYVITSSNKQAIHQYRFNSAANQKIDHKKDPVVAIVHADQTEK
ncbi:MAG TPA: hypothetical protein VGF30_09180 [Bacteroidia bacterium]